MKKLLLLFLSLSLLFCSCDVSEIENSAKESESQTKKVNNSTFGVAYAGSESMDPYKTSNTLNSELMGLICEPLFSLSETFEAVPCLCTDFTYSDRTYVFNIRRDATFSDGSMLTASDIAYSLQCALESGSYYSKRLSIIESIRPSDKDAAVTIKLRYDNSRFPTLLDIPIIKSNTRDDLFPCGTGIYAPNTDKTLLVMRRNHHSKKLPVYETIRLTDVSSFDELIFEFDTHNVSILSTDPTGNSPITPMSAAKITNVVGTKMHYLGFNTKKSPLNDKNVRRAIAKAIDRESASVGDFALMGNAAALPIHPKSNLYNNEIANELSYDGNTKLPIDDTLTILVNSENSGKLAVCKRIAETLTRLGAPTTVRALPFKEYAAALSRGDFTLYYAESSLSPDFDLTRLLSGSLNYGSFYDGNLITLHSAYLSGDEAANDFFRAFCDICPFAPILFKDTAIYTEDGFFKESSPTSQNIYHNFSDWILGE